MSEHDIKLLRALPDPALFARDGRVLCFNEAALTPFPELVENCPLPATLPRNGAGAGLVCAGGQSWHMTVSPMEDGSIFLLHPARLEGMSRPQLDGTVRRLREQLAQLLLCVQLPGEDSTAQMNRTICRMLRQVELLDLLRDLDERHAPFRPVTLDLAGLCRETVAAAQGLLEISGVTLRLDSTMSSLLVRGDSALLKKLLLELIANAARAAGHGGVLELSLSRLDERAVLTLSGGGAADAGRPLSQMLSGDRADDQIPAPGEGAGLGLVLAQHIVALHGGALMMERRDGIHVTVALPRAGHSEPLPVHAPKLDYIAGFEPALVWLSDLLPAESFAPVELD